MTGSEAIEYIESISWTGSKLGLDRTRELLEKLGNPEQKLKFIHLAGTNGKGSTASMLASILQEAGYVTGLYTSPFIQRFNERMKVNGEDIPDGELGEMTLLVKQVADAMEDQPTEFEIITCVAFLWYLRRGCDIVVLETGLGGRLDSTNVIPAPIVSVIANIGLDHMKELGDTTVKIAGEKAGIIKSGSAAVIYQQEIDVENVFRTVCREKAVPLTIADFSQLAVNCDTISGQNFDYKDWKNVEIHLLGGHQRRNAAVVLETVGVLRERGIAVSDAAVRRGLALAKWPGRFELLHRAPDFIADGGHNLQCMGSVVDALEEYFKNRRVIFVVGVLADKDYAAMMQLIAPRAKMFFTITPNSPRALSAQALAEHLAPFGKPATACENVGEAVARAFAQVEDGDLICSVGSLYMTGEVRTCVLNRA